MTTQTPQTFAPPILPPPPSWAPQADAPWPRWDGFPRQYRLDQVNGVWLLGDKQLTPDLEVIPLDYRWATGQNDQGVERWGFPRQIWLDLAFVDPEGFVSVASLKKSSAINVHCTLQEILALGFSPSIYRWLVELNPVEAPEGVYYTARVGKAALVSEREYWALRAFIASGDFRWRLIGETGPDADASYDDSGY